MNGDDQQFEETPVTLPDGSIIPVRHPKFERDPTGQIKPEDRRQLFAYAKRQYDLAQARTSPPVTSSSASPDPIDLTAAAANVDPEEVLKGFPSGVARGLANLPALAGEMGRAEIEAAAAPFTDKTDLPPSLTVEQIAQPLRTGFSKATFGYIPEERPTTPSGQAGERMGEFLADIPSWIGPGGKIIKAAGALLGGLGSYIGEQLGGAKGAVLGGVAGGGITGLASPRGLTPRPPHRIRAATTQEKTYEASKAGYRELATLDYEMDPLAASQIRQAIESDLTKHNPNEPDRMLILPDQAPQVFEHLKLLSQSSAKPGKITVNDVERVRQILQADRLNSRVTAPAQAEAAGRAIAVIDELMEALPGVKGITEQARGNWSAYKRGQMVEETLRRAIDRAGTSGTGFNIDNAIRQEFRTRIRNNPKVWGRFTRREQQEIELIMNPGKTANFLGRYISRFGPHHILTGTLGTGGIGFVTGHPLEALAALATGFTGHHLAKHLAQGRAERLAEITRARSPAGGGYEPGRLLSAPERGGAAGARALGATALSPEATEAIELPEIVVTPQ